MKENIEKIVDDALRTEPSFKLRNDFKDRVLHTLKRREKANQRKFYIWMVIGIVTIFGFGFATVSYFLPTLFENFSGIKNGSDKLIPLAVLAGILVIIVQYLDKQLVQKKLLLRE